MPTDSQLDGCIVTTCKGRLEFLRQTLPLMIATGLPVTVVDFDCPDGTADYVGQNHPAVNVVHLKNQPIFSLSIARNEGARHSKGALIAFIDSDVMLTEGFGAFVRARERSEDEFFTGDLGNSLAGQCLVPRGRFDEIGGYDEAIVGWGFEDYDLYSRLTAKGARQELFPSGLMSSIPHAESLRLRFTGENKNRWVSHRINSVYSHIKRDIEGASRPLTLKERRDLRQMVERVIGRLRASGSGALAFSLPLKELSLAVTPDVLASDTKAKEGAYHLDCSLTYTLSLGKGAARRS
jgi:glycosyltransferase involved in cell wall biosynthesis